LSTSVPLPKVEVVVVVATVVSSVGAGVGTGVIASTFDVNVGVLVGAASLTSFAGLGVVVVGQHEFLCKLLNEHI
jgi:hypothetical protein